MPSRMSLSGVLEHAPYLGCSLVWKEGEGRGVIPCQRDADVGGEEIGLSSTW